MLYWQITTSRLSKAARKLNNDGNWHPLERTPHAWYRVWKKRLVQRVNFESEAEQHILLPQITELEPVGSLGRTTGFREEIDIRLKEDHLWMLAPLGYANDNMEKIEKALMSENIRLSVEQTIAVAHIPLPALTAPDILLARERVTLAQLLFAESNAA